MRPDSSVRIIEVLAIAAVPFATKGVLAIMARSWKANLRPTLPWLHTLRWVLWLIGMLIVSFALLKPGGVQFSAFAIGMALVGSSAGFGIVERWVKRRYAPELLPPESPDGWWP